MVRRLEGRGGGRRGGEGRESGRGEGREGGRGRGKRGGGEGKREVERDKRGGEGGR